MKHKIVTDDARACFVNRLSIRVSGQFFESLTVLLTVYLTFLLTRARDHEILTNFLKNKFPEKQKANRRKKHDRRKNNNS
jgi:hypothetical protein